MKRFGKLVIGLMAALGLASNLFAEGSISVRTSAKYDVTAGFHNTLGLDASFGASAFPGNRVSVFADTAGGITWAPFDESLRVVASAAGLGSYRRGPWYAGFEADGILDYLLTPESAESLVSADFRVPLRYGRAAASVYVEPELTIGNVRSWDLSRFDLTPKATLGTSLLVGESVVLDLGASGSYTIHGDQTDTTVWSGDLIGTWYPILPLVAELCLGVTRRQSSRQAQLVSGGESLPIHNHSDVSLGMKVSGTVQKLVYEVSVPLLLRFNDHGALIDSSVSGERQRTFAATIVAAGRFRPTDGISADARMTLHLVSSNSPQLNKSSVSLDLGLTYRF